MWAGFTLFWFSGGSLLVILGLIPGTIIIAGIGIASMGLVSAGTLAFMTGLGVVWAAIGIPLALRGASWFEEGLGELTGFKLGLMQVVLNGTNKIPIVGDVVDISTR